MVVKYAATCHFLSVFQILILQWHYVPNSVHVIIWEFKNMKLDFINASTKLYSTYNRHNQLQQNAASIHDFILYPLASIINKNFLRSKITDLAAWLQNFSHPSATANESIKNMEAKIKGKQNINTLLRLRGSGIQCSKTSLQFIVLIKHNNKHHVSIHNHHYHHHTSLSTTITHQETD